MRNVSLNILEQLLATTTDEVFLLILEITHEDLSTPLRFVRNTESITHDGDVYTAFPFELKLPRESQDRLPKAQLSLDIVNSPEIRQWVRSTMVSAIAEIKIVAASDPDTVIAGPWRYALKRRTMDASVLQCDLTLDDEIGRKFPEGTLSPFVAPGLFN